MQVRVPLKLLVPLLAISILSVYSFAVTFVVTTVPLQAADGILFEVNGGFTGVNNGFAIAPAMSVASMLPVKWLSGSVCQTALTTGNWFYAFTLTITTNAQTNHAYSVTASWDNGSGYTSLGTLTVTSPSTIIAGQTMIFYFNTGLTSINMPAAIVVTEQ